VAEIHGTTIVPSGKQMTKVPNIPGTFSELEVMSGNLKIGIERDILFVCLEHGTPLIQEHLIQVRSYLDGFLLIKSHIQQSSLQSLGNIILLARIPNLELVLV
jgi:hypothetical protein